MIKETLQKELLKDALHSIKKEQINNIELNEYRDVYQDLFDHVPCFITVQDKNYKLLRYNREFYETFNPEPGQYCYQAYKGLEEKCAVCPVEKTFEDCKSHLSEESGPNKDGKILHWVVKTSPIKNSKDEIVAVMEMCLDITYKKKLEEEVALSVRKYHAIFNNIPNPLFVLDAETLEILDCNGSVKSVYGYSGDEIIGKYFPMFFKSEEKEKYISLVKSSTTLNQARHLTKESREIFVNIRISPSEHLDQKSLLVTTSDITQQLEIEHQLIQASKMATLGAMATGIAHELNQPLSVIKSASNYFVRKIEKKEDIGKDNLITLSKKIADNVDRATKIINHMREFGRKSPVSLEKVRVNEVLKRAHEVLGQQLKVRGIRVIWKLKEGLPFIMADSVRLEQVFINLFLNARDALEENSNHPKNKLVHGIITISTYRERNDVIVEIHDTGPGVPEAIKDKIFEPFFTTKKVGKGTGLGLSISYGIVEECCGTIELASEMDIGACFKIRFPVPNKE